MQPPPPLGPSPEDLQATVAMYRVVGRFGRRLWQICEVAAEALENIAAGHVPAQLDPEDDDDEVARQRADDDGWPTGD